MSELDNRGIFDGSASARSSLRTEARLAKAEGQVTELAAEIERMRRTIETQAAELSRLRAANAKLVEAAKRTLGMKLSHEIKPGCNCTWCDLARAVEAGQPIGF